MDTQKTLFVELNNHCRLRECKIELCFQLYKPIKNTISIWIFIVVYNESGPISYCTNSGDGDATLLESVHCGFYNLNTKMVETSEMYEFEKGP